LGENLYFKRFEVNSSIAFSLRTSTTTLEQARYFPAY
jgi:hypothetical protein